MIAPPSNIGIVSGSSSSTVPQMTAVNGLSAMNTPERVAPMRRMPSIADIHDAKRVALDLLLILILSAPLNHAGRNSIGIWGVNRQGCRFSRPAPWMARGGGPPNHWRITGTPSLSEVPSGGARAFCLLLTGPAFRLFKSEPLSERNPKQPLPQQWICTQSVDCEAVFAGKPAPTFGLRCVR